MSRSHYDVLICGATLAGLGAAAAALHRNRSVLVVERTALVGREFIEAFHPGRGGEIPQSAFARQLRDDLLARNLMEAHGPVHLPALHPILCHLIKQLAIQVNFLTEIVEVAPEAGSYRVLLHNAAGLHEVTADRLLDTSSERLSTPGQLPVPSSKSLNAYVHHRAEPAADVPAPIDESMSLVYGRFASERVLQYKVAPEAEWPQARQQLYQYWKSRPQQWAPWTISAIASVFEWTVPCGPHERAERWHWLPSGAYDDPLAALDQGYAYNSNLEARSHAATANE